MNLWIVSTLLIIIIILLIGIIYLHTKSDPTKLQNEESIKDIDKAIERQEGTLSVLTKDIQSFQDPLDKLRRYLSGGTLAGKFGEWSLEAIMQDIFHSNQYYVLSFPFLEEPNPITYLYNHNLFNEDKKHCCYNSLVSSLANTSRTLACIKSFVTTYYSDCKSKYQRFSNRRENIKEGDITKSALKEVRKTCCIVCMYGYK